MERAAHTAQRGHQQNGPRGQGRPPGHEGQHQGDGPDGPVGGNHDGPPVKAVGKGPGEQGQNPLGQQSRHGGQGQNGG